MFGNNYSSSGPTPPKPTLPPLNVSATSAGSSIEERLSSCERGLQFLMEESVRARGMLRLQLQQIGQGGGAAVHETSLLRSQLVATQSQMASFMRQSTRQAFLEVERERLLTSQEEFSNQARLDTNIGRVAGELRDLSQRVSQTTQLSERHLDGLSRDVESGTVSVKRLSANFSSLSSSLHKSDERLSAHLSQLEAATSQEHQAILSSMAVRAEKCREMYHSLEESWTNETSQLRGALSILADSMRELTGTTSRKLQLLSEAEGRERETLERMLLREVTNTRDKLEFRLDSLQTRVASVEVDVKQRCKKLGKLLTQLQGSLNILEREIEAERLRTNHLLQAEITARKDAVSKLQSDADKTRADLLTLLNSAHQANQLTELRLQQLETKLEQSLTALTSELQEYRSDCQQSAGQMASLRESVIKELTSLEIVQKLKEEFSHFKLELEGRLTGVNQRLDTLNTAEGGIRVEVGHLSHKLLQMKEEQTQKSDGISSELTNTKQNLLELNSLLQPLLNIPQAVSSLSTQTQQMETWIKQHNDETLQINRTIQAIQHMFSQKLHLEETARVSALSSLRSELHVIQSNFPHLTLPPTYPMHSSVPLDQSPLPHPPHSKPSTLHIPKQPSLSLTFPSFYDQLTSVTLPTSTCATVQSNPFSSLSVAHSKQPHSTPKGNPTTLTDPQYTTSPIEGEMRVISSIRSQDAQEQKAGAGSTETSNEESPASITDKFQCITDEQTFTPLVLESIPSASSSPPGENKRDSTQSVQDRVLSMIREESESLIPSETNLQSVPSSDSSQAVPVMNTQQGVVSKEKPVSTDVANQEDDQLSPLHPSKLDSSRSSTVLSRQYSLPESLGKERPSREYRRLRTVESVARQSFVKSPTPLLTQISQDAILEVADEQGLNEWGLYQAVFWLKIKTRLMRPVLKLRERLSSDS